MTSPIEHSPQSNSNTPPNIHVLDMDAMRVVGNDGLPGRVLDTAGIGEFFQNHDVHGRLQDNIGIGFFRADGTFHEANPQASPLGFHAKDFELEVDGTPMPVPILLGHDEKISNKNLANSLKHETYHYLYGDRNPDARLYHQEGLKTKVRLGALATSLTLFSTVPDLFDPSGALMEQASALGFVGTFTALSMTALYGARVAKDPYLFLDRLDSEERGAKAFTRRHKDFQPVKPRHYSW